MIPSIKVVAPNVYLLLGQVGTRPLYLPLLVGRDAALLIDTGCAHHFEDLIKPSFETLGISLEQLSYIITTHCDSDHQGSNAAIKRAAPDATLACGAEDRKQVEDPQEIWRQRYDRYRSDHHHYYSDETKREILEALGSAQCVDTVFYSGDKLQLDPDWILEILHLPGHTAGHLAVWDHRNKILFGGDAIHGSGYLDLDGYLALCPTYLDVPSYRATISRVETLAIDTYVGSHWPVATGRDEIQAFCRESRDFVDRAEKLLIEQITRVWPKGSSLSDLCNIVGPRLGTWPANINAELCYAFNGHLRDLTSRGRIREDRSSTPFHYFST